MCKEAHDVIPVNTGIQGINRLDSRSGSGMTDNS